MKQIKRNYQQLEKLLIIILIFGLVFSVWQIVNALHNLDTIHNANKIEYEFDVKITDTGSDFIERPIQDYYIQSMNDLKKYVLFSIFISLIIGYLIGDLKWKKKQEITYKKSKKK